MGICVSAFAGAGKSTAMKNLKVYGITSCDSDSSHFNFLMNEDGQYINTSLEVVHTKEERVKNPNFLTDYKNHILSQLKIFDVVFISAHEEVREMMYDNNIDFVMVGFQRNCKDKVVDRIRNRKTAQPNNIIANIVNDNWDEWLDSMDKFNPMFTIRLNGENYLEDGLSLAMRIKDKILLVEGNISLYENLVKNNKSKIFNHPDFKITVMDTTKIPNKFIESSNLALADSNKKFYRYSD